MGTKFVVREQDLLMVMQIALRHMLKDDTLAAPLMERLTTSVKSYLHEECERIEDGKIVNASLDEVITKRAAIDALNHLCLYPGEWAVNGLGLCKDAIANLPSIDIDYIIVSHEEIGYERGLRDGYAQAVTESEATEQWIPCSEVTGEGYPKEDGFYYVTERNYGFYLDADTKQNVAHTSRFFNGDFTDRVYDENHSNIVAWLSLDWMSLPDPYKAEMEKETCNNTEENLQ